MQSHSYAAAHFQQPCASSNIVLRFLHTRSAGYPGRLNCCSPARLVRSGLGDWITSWLSPGFRLADSASVAKPGSQLHHWPRDPIRPFFGVAPGEQQVLAGSRARSMGRDPCYVWFWTPNVGTGSRGERVSGLRWIAPSATNDWSYGACRKQRLNEVVSFLHAA